MKKNIIKVLFIFIAAVCLTACGQKEMKDYKLKIIESSWSGWSEDYKPEEKTSEHEIVLDKEYVISEGSLGLKFTITKINKDSIVIKTTEPFMEGDEGGLDTDKKEFVVKNGETLKLTTPSMDAGNIFYLSLEKAS